MTFALRASAKPLNLAAGALAVAMWLSSPAQAHEKPEALYGQSQAYHFAPYGGFVGYGPGVDESRRGEPREWSERARASEADFKHKHQRKKKHKHARPHVPHEHGPWGDRHRHGHRHAQALRAPGVNCHPVQTVEVFRGRLAKIGGVGCYDARGHFRVLPQSRHLIHYIAY